MTPVLVLPDGRRVPIRKSVASLGSDPACDVVVAVGGVKRSHALVFKDERGWSLASAGKGCEVRVNGRRVDAAPIACGDVLSLGPARLKVEDEEPSPQGPNEFGAGRAAASAPETVLAALDAFAARLLANRPPPELLAAALDGVARAAGAQAGFVVSAGADGRRVLARTGEAPEAIVADALLDRALGSGAPVHVPDVAADATIAGAQSVVALRFTSAIAVPLRAPGSLPAAVILGRRAGAPPFTEADLSTATSLAALASLLLSAARELSELRAEVEGLTRRIAAATFEGMVGDSAPMRDLYRTIERVGPTGLNVLLTGETGTGKELVARALHRRSARRGRFVPVHCGAIPRDLIERELFGHARGAFSGADADRPGLFEAADGGTLLLDEIGEMPVDLQTRLLRAIQEREVTRLGEVRPRKLDVRVIAATHADLGAAVAAGRFRQDLLYRLDEVRIALTPLRARGDDVLLIAHKTLAAEAGRAKGFTQKAIEVVRGHPFPGNVRELVARVRRAAVLTSAELVGPGDLGLGDEEPLVSLEEAREAFVRRYVREAIARCGGKKKDAARALGIGLRSLFRYLGES